ncbi:MAG: membrane lipoprotein lipid attachment site-containing protein [Oscillospiraceae bacterium]|jgi:hypothetical protein|nr:membrane lipoprotein lipid attachment site-containing protein [Oscillospiraceae bacterium]
MKRMIAILIFAALILSGCNNNEIQEKNVVIEELRREIEALQNEIAYRDVIIAESEPQEEKSVQDAQREEFLEWQEEHFRRVREDLMSRPDLIPFEGVHGGMPGFYYEEHIHVEWGHVLAYAEDGHFAAYLVLTYLEEDGEIIWDLFAYSMIDGLGFRPIE